MWVRTAKFRRGPKINAAARIDAAVELFRIGRGILRHHADPFDRPALGAGNVYVEKRAALRLLREDLLDDVPSPRGAGDEVGRRRFGVFLRAGNARLTKEGSLDRSGDSPRIEHIDAGVRAG